MRLKSWFLRWWFSVPFHVMSRLNPSRHIMSGFCTRLWWIASQKVRKKGERKATDTDQISIHRKFLFSPSHCHKRKFFSRFSTCNFTTDFLSLLSTYFLNALMHWRFGEGVRISITMGQLSLIHGILHFKMDVRQGGKIVNTGPLHSWQFYGYCEGKETKLSFEELSYQQ